jgi:hypothetical protein
MVSVGMSCPYSIAVSVDWRILIGMVRDISQDQFLAATADTLAAARSDSFVISKDGEFVAALVSERDYVDLRRLRSQRVSKAMDAISDAIDASGAGEADLKELEKALDRHA